MSSKRSRNRHPNPHGDTLLPQSLVLLPGTFPVFCIGDYARGVAPEPDLACFRSRFYNCDGAVPTFFCYQPGKPLPSFSTSKPRICVHLRRSSRIQGPGVEAPWISRANFLWPLCIPWRLPFSRTFYCTPYSILPGTSLSPGCDTSSAAGNSGVLHFLPLFRDAIFEAQE